MVKFTEVELENTAANSRQTFEINHAERLLRMPNNGGWQLPEDSPYYFEPRNGIGYKQTKKGSTKPEETGNDTTSDNAPKQD